MIEIKMLQDEFMKFIDVKNNITIKSPIIP